MKKNVPFIGEFKVSNTAERVKISLKLNIGDDFYKVESDFDGTNYNKENIASIHDTSSKDQYVKMRKDGGPQAFINILQMTILMDQIILEFKIDLIKYVKTLRIQKAISYNPYHNMLKCKRLESRFI
jgi:hypothetical protein